MTAQDAACSVSLHLKCFQCCLSEAAVTVGDGKKNKPLIPMVRGGSPSPHLSQS